MKGADQIRKALISEGWTEGEANAAAIWFGAAHYLPWTEWYGWHIMPFNEKPYFMGHNISEALSQIKG